MCVFGVTDVRKLGICRYIVHYPKIRRWAIQSSAQISKVVQRTTRFGINTLLYFLYSYNYKSENSDNLSDKIDYTKQSIQSKLCATHPKSGSKRVPATIHHHCCDVCFPTANSSPIRNDPRHHSRVVVAARHRTHFERGFLRPPALSGTGSAQLFTRLRKTHNRRTFGICLNQRNEPLFFLQGNVSSIEQKRIVIRPGAFPLL